MSAVVAAVAVVAASTLVGGAACCRRGEWSWTAPGVGLAVMMVTAWVAVKLPGHGTTAGVALAALVVLAVVQLARGGVRLRDAAAGLPAGAVGLALALLPFLATHRFGNLGASIDDDLVTHLQVADALRHSGAQLTHYPLGPHSLVAGLAQVSGIGVQDVFAGLMPATLAIGALTALAGLAGLAWPARMAAATAVGVAYLPASYMAEGSFKEPLVGVFVLTFALVLGEALREGLSPRRIVLLLALAAACVSAFGAAGLLWPAIGAAWTLVLARGRDTWRTLRRMAARPRVVAAAGVAIAAAAVAATAGAGFFRGGPGKFALSHGAGGNFVGQLSPFEALGVWPAQDFRLMETKGWLPIGVAVAVGVLGYGLVLCWRRRETALLAMALAGASVYVVARPASLAYFSGKALAIASPVLVLIACRFLGWGEGRPWTRVARTAALATFVLLAVYSSALALRSAQVRPNGRGPDMARFRALVGDSPVLYLGRSNWFAWDLNAPHGLSFQRYATGRIKRLSPRNGKAPEDTAAMVDVDSPYPGILDSVRYVITTRTAYQSAMPPNFRRVARTRWHALWRRTGSTPERGVLDERGAPGAVLDCARPAQRALARRRGSAFVRPAPIVGGQQLWRTPSGAPPSGYGKASAGSTLVQAPSLPRGRWELSLGYSSAVPLDVRIGPARYTLPAYTDDGSSFLHIASVEGGRGAVKVEVRPRARRDPDVVRAAFLGPLAATRVDVPGRIVPLRRACGRYVDWYRLAPARASG